MKRTVYRLFERPSRRKRRVLKKIAFEAPVDVWIKMLSDDQQQMYLESIKRVTMAHFRRITDVSFRFVDQICVI